MRLKICCKELEENICAFKFRYSITQGETDDIEISTYEDHYYRLEYVKFCPFCGKKLEV